MLFHGPSKETRKSGAWLITYADMMALLLTFFILMLSMADPNPERYRAVSEGMEAAFDGKKKEKSHANDEIIPIDHDTGGDGILPGGEAVTQRLTLFRQLGDVLALEIERGLLEIDLQDEEIIFRFPETVAFDSGSAVLSEAFYPLLRKVGGLLEKNEGVIEVTGHTDDIPIYNERFRSNWDLSAARAASVVHALLASSKIKASRLSAIGQADTRPLVANVSISTRALNRRVEVRLLSQQPRPADPAI